MGLFDKRDKRKKGGISDDFDSPVEQIDLSDDEPAPAASAASAAPASDGAPESPRTIEAEPPPARTPARREPDFDAPDYGIQKAIELMRTLPQENIELVVTVIKHTLESTRINIRDIIEDATRKQEDIQGRIKVLKTEIADFEQEIATRKEEIGTLEADFTETSTVKERLELAEKIDKKDTAAPAKPAASTGSRPGNPVHSKSGTISGSHPVKPSAPKPGSGQTSAGSSSSQSSSSSSLPKPKPKTTVIAKK